MRQQFVFFESLRRYSCLWGREFFLVVLVSESASERESLRTVQLGHVLHVDVYVVLDVWNRVLDRVLVVLHLLNVLLDLHLTHLPIIITLVSFTYFWD